MAIRALLSSRQTSPPVTVRTEIPVTGCHLDKDVWGKLPLDLGTMTGVCKHTGIRGVGGMPLFLPPPVFVFVFRLSRMVCGWVLEVKWSLSDLIYKFLRGKLGSWEGKLPPPYHTHYFLQPEKPHKL